MAQHDYVIDNQSAASFRADINTALAAIVSNNSGSTAPTPTYAHQIWADTTAGLLKMRNAGNSAWLTIGTLGATNLGLAQLPSGANLGSFAGVAMLCGIGFTMSLFIGDLAFDQPRLVEEARAGILAGSLLSAFLGLVWLARATPAR